MQPSARENKRPSATRVASMHRLHPCASIDGAADGIAGETGRHTARNVLAVCLGLAVWEIWWPRRSDVHRRTRWPMNLSLALVNAVIVRVLAPASGVTFALLAGRAGWGCCAPSTLPEMLEWAVAVLVLDAAVYVQHRLFHAVPWLWPSTACITPTAASTSPPACVSIPGRSRSPPSTRARGSSRWARRRGPRSLRDRPQHGLPLLPRQRARARRPALAAAAGHARMHRVHHSTDSVEQNTNYGFSFSWWDRIGGTYRPAPRQPHETMPSLEIRMPTGPP